MRRAVELDPLTPLWRGVLLAHLVCAGKYDEALDEGRKGLPKNEVHPLLGIAEAYLALGRLDEALAAAERAYRNLPQHSMSAGFYAATLVRVGEKDRAAGIIREMGDTPTPIWGRACTLAVLGDRRSCTLVPPNDQSARAVRAGLCQLAVHRGTAGQPALAEFGRDDEPHSDLTAQTQRIHSTAQMKD